MNLAIYQNRHYVLTGSRSFEECGSEEIAQQIESQSINLMKIALGTDHAGFAHKERIKEWLLARGHEVKDFGTNSEAAVDYPVHVRPAAEAVARGECDRGIVLGGSGNGEAIVANKVRGVRCALCWSEDTARWGRQHNDANVLAIGQRTVDLETALKIVEIFLATSFEGGRHARRVGMIESD